MIKANTAPWLKAAVAYLPQWLEYQIERYRRLGCAVAIAHGTSLVYEQAFGIADIHSGKPLNPRHRFRAASHSKSFTAAGIMLLRENGKIGLDDSVGCYVSGLHKELAKARISELLSHSAGVIRDGVDSGQWVDAKPFPSREALAAALAVKQPLEPGTQLKYSNFGYALLGRVIEEISGETYCDWITQRVVKAAGLSETVADVVHLSKRAPMAKGHSGEWPLPARVVVAGDNPTHAMAPAAGFVSTAADLVKFYSQLAPEAKKSFLPAASRREMIHRRWHDEHSANPQHYGYGIISGGHGAKAWFGHTGGFQGFVSRTACFPAMGCTISVLCHALDGLPFQWVDGIASVLNVFQRDGAPSKRVADWSGRWSTMWGDTDLVAAGDHAFAVNPAMQVPFDDYPTEFAVGRSDTGTILKTSSFGSPGEPVRRVRDRSGRVVEVWIGGIRLVAPRAVKAEMVYRYGAPRLAPQRRR
jgi:D-alanyl-D-alanine carboxypeptidase